ncbi:MAG: ORF6N domain-containing protein [Daejeonella sp.]
MPPKQIFCVISDQVVINKIYEIRGSKIMLDRDIADLYGIETKVLKQAVKRHITRFPEDFMFEMSNEELSIWRSQIVTSKSDKKGLRYKPFCFTEHGILMLSSVLNSQQAIQVNIQVIRIFTRLKQMLNNQNELKIEIEEIKKKLNSQDKNIEVVFSYLDELIDKKGNLKSRKRIGYMPDEL